MAEEKESMENEDEGKTPKKSFFKWIFLMGIVLLVVIGATMTVEMCLFISFGDTTRHGRVFLISRPRVGSREMRKTSNRFTSIPILPHPTLGQTRQHDPIAHRLHT